MTPKPASPKSPQRVSSTSRAPTPPPAPRAGSPGAKQSLASPRSPAPNSSLKTESKREPTPEPPIPQSVVEESNEKKQGDKDEKVIDMDTFSQILELDEEEDDHSFSYGMTTSYFDQVESTFQDMDTAYSEKDLAKLSDLGHFLKGSSAALGVFRVQASCEKIQHYGKLRDEDTGKNLTRPEALQRIDETLKTAKVQFDSARKWLQDYYTKLESESG